MMFKLPTSCKVNRIIPKKTFYENININPTLKNSFINDVEKIIWIYKLAPETLGISVKEDIYEIQIFQVNLKKQVIPIRILEAITKVVEYPILFVIYSENNYCFAMKYNNIYITDWNLQIDFDFFALNLKELYESLMKSIINQNDSECSLDSLLIKVEKKQRILSAINILESKINTERQFNRKAELNNELNKLKKEMEKL